MLKDIADEKMVTPAARREAVAHLCSVHGVSQRRACRTIGAERTSIRYRHRRVDDGAMRSRLRELAAVRRRFGWRRLHVLLSREGVRVNHKKLRRLYNGCRFAGVADASGPWAPGRRWLLPQGPNQRWSLDFVSDTLTDGEPYRILAMVDDYTREYLSSWWLTLPCPGLRVVRELDALIARRGRPLGCVSDNGTELTSTWRSCVGRRRAAWTGTTSHLASRRRTPSSRASTVGYATSC